MIKLVVVALLVCSCDIVSQSRLVMCLSTTLDEMG